MRSQSYSEKRLKALLLNLPEWEGLAQIISANRAAPKGWSLLASNVNHQRPLSTSLATLITLALLAVNLPENLYTALQHSNHLMQMGLYLISVAVERGR
ncbi:hypothetical protein AVEN_109950-1 [Araneus ventricosus]|uniref:Uncharacterized protein n=1 Tax=Araneus ventricosus TaxID=182803 RepID=A0A4Y2KQQ0_ARAVE|nr:hypothetical protein AVEN_109950-1 [Araneus ventricosus]